MLKRQMPVKRMIQKLLLMTRYLFLYLLDEYTSPKKFQETKDGYTIQNSDVIVVGIVEKDVESLKDLKDMDDVYTVNSVEVIDYSKCLNHIEVYAS